MLYYNPKPGSTPEEKISGQLIHKHYRDPFNGERAPIAGSANEESMKREAQSIRKGLEQTQTPMNEGEKLMNLGSFLENQAMQQRDVNAELVRRLLGN